MGAIIAIVLLVLVVGLAIFAVIRSVRIVPQARAGIVERFGRYHRTLHAGLNVVVPFIDRLRPLIDLREQVVSFPPQPVITRDNLVVGIDTVIYFQVTDPKAATYEIANYVAAVEQLTVTTLRNVVGGMDLDMTLTSRDKINSELRKELDEATGRWGLRVSRVELKAIEPPASIQGSMEKQMRADRDKRAAILSAEGAKQSAILTAEGERQAAVLRARGEAEAAVVRADADATAQATRARGEAQAIATVFQAIHEGNPDQRLLAYKYLEMLPEIAQGGANKLWIVPSELGKALEGLGGLFGNANDAAPGAAARCRDTPEALPGPTAAAASPACRCKRPPAPKPREPWSGGGLPGEASGLGACGGRTWTRPESVTRVSNVGCLAVAGPCSTAPSLSLKVDPCHGQVTQAAPPTLATRPWCSGPPRCAQWSESTWTAVAVAHREHAQVAELAADRPPLGQLRRAGTGRASRARPGDRSARRGSPRPRAAARGGRPGSAPAVAAAGRRRTAAWPVPRRPAARASSEPANSVVAPACAIACTSPTRCWWRCSADQSASPVAAAGTAAATPAATSVAAARSAPGRRTGRAAPRRSSSRAASGPGPDERAARTARRAARRSAGRRQGAHHEAGQRADRAVEGLRALDALGDRRRPGGAQRRPRRPQRLVTGDLPHNPDVPRQTGVVTQAR